MKISLPSEQHVEYRDGLLDGTEQAAQHQLGAQEETIGVLPCDMHDLREMVDRALQILGFLTLEMEQQRKEHQLQCDRLEDTIGTLLNEVCDAKEKNEEPQRKETGYCNYNLIDFVYDHALTRQWTGTDELYDDIAELVDGGIRYWEDMGVFYQAMASLQVLST